MGTLLIDLLLFTVISLVFIFPIPLIESQQVIISSTDPAYYYNLCSTSTCGNLSLPYPFAFPSFCSHPDIRTTCVNNDHLLVYSSEVPESEPARVLNSFSFDASGISVLVAIDSLFGCGGVTRKKYVAGRAPFSLPYSYTFGYLLNCTQRPTSAAPGTLEPSSCLDCKGSKAGGNNLCFYTPMLTSYPDCENFFIYVKNEVNVSAIGDLRGYLRRGFELRYTIPTSCQGCQSTGGKCGSSPGGYFICFCASSANRFNCSDGIVEDLQTWFPRGKQSKISKGVIAAVSVSASVASLVVFATVISICVTRHKAKNKVDDDIDPIDISVSETSFQGLVNGLSPKRYSHSQIKKFTNKFSTMLGEGGFGSVYKGFIQGIGPVAVKLLDRSEQSKKQFMNEVATVGRIHHQNLVRLLGYCAEGKTRALVYEFMEKGSLDKYICVKELEEHQGGKERKVTLTAQQMYNIAMETAKGITYLHEGCRSRILHLDIKPHNVLLNSNFSAKVADFGLAQMFDKDHSHVSLTNALGTPGYAAPEIWNKTYGPVTDKSDVYSYGMLLLEMVRRRKNCDLGAGSSSQVYFPDYIFQKAERGELQMNTMIHEATQKTEVEEKEGEKEGEAEEEADEILAKMCLVGLWCVQHFPSNRPTMSTVIQMLEGNVEIKIPPHPFPTEFNWEDFFSCYFTAFE
ncbi:hypothetical protein H6P81_001804 [Aristolochia fimbriata]|uniref:non-specific serine/threonine protein kinase n=1 Tax=Aristolochia fimbriata TaxID=158543 RepID=A0AAV7F928_ARIFI|nr:hypothetical protein H6P81_001804 [Aristolochia fimbriata]